MKNPTGVKIGQTQWLLFWKMIFAVITIFSIYFVGASLLRSYREFERKDAIEYYKGCLDMYSPEAYTCSFTIPTTTTTKSNCHQGSLAEQKENEPSCANGAVSVFDGKSFDALIY